MANANENPELEVGFCTEGTAIDIPESLRLLGVTPENPTIHGHVINKLFKMIFENLNHQKKKAISFWEPDEYYIATANNIDICRRNNKIYFCKQTHNDTGTAPKDPATNPDYWTVLYDLDNPASEKHFVYVSRNSNLSIAQGSPFHIPFNNVLKDDYNLYDVNTDLITIEKDGFYDVRSCVHLTPSSSGNSAFIHILVNGVITGASKSGNGGSYEGLTSFVASAILDLKAGDTVGIYMFTSSQNTVNTFNDNDHCYFSLREL